MSFFSIRKEIRWIIDPNSKGNFIKKLPADSKVLDIGCGHHSPKYFKFANPHIRYTGIDIEDFDLDEEDREFADRLLFVDPDKFAATIASMPATFDAMVSCQNIEHVNAPEECLQAMASALKPGGTLYLSFPAEATLRFPKRKGTLNFHDDPTHQWMPQPGTIIAQMESAGCTVIRQTLRNRPLTGFILGALTEPLSMLTRRVWAYTWHFWGFETILYFQKKQIPGESPHPAATTSDPG